jgi:thymidylate synthase
MKYTHENGTPFTKEEFLKKLKTDKEFNDEFGNKGIDQISDLIKQLKENPDSRRLLVSVWNASDLPHQVLPPCHYGFQVYTRELSAKERIELAGGKIQEKYPALIEQQIKHCDKHNVPKRAISLMFNMRSTDVPLGLPFNLASYGLLLEIIAKEVNMVPDELIGNLGDTHIYLNQIEGIKEQLTREPFELPKVLKKDEYHYLADMDIPFSEKINAFKPDFWKLENYQSHPSIKLPLSN